MSEQIIHNNSVTRQEPTKERLMHSAASLFIRKGYYGTSIQNLTNDCHLSKSSFYDNFSSKKELLTQLFDESYKQLFEIIIPASFNTNYRADKRIEEFMLHVRKYLACTRNRLMFVQSNEFASILKNQDTNFDDFYNNWLHTFKPLIGTNYGERWAEMLSKILLDQLAGAALLSEATQDPNIIDIACDNIVTFLINTHTGETDMSDFKDLVSKELLNAADNGDAKAQFEIGMTALRHHRLGFADIYLKMAKRNLIG